MNQTPPSSVQHASSLAGLTRKRKAANPDQSGSIILGKGSKSIRVNPDKPNKGLQLDGCPQYGPDTSKTVLGTDCDDIIVKKSGDLGTKNFQHPLVQKKSPEYPIGHHDRPTEIGNYASNVPVNMPFKAVEKLWDGSLQLSATIAVSALAFFKSGEKASKINWPKTVEVKGKVRLDAFEKFIQELPRSRNRTLMVTSLCWNVGSSKTGLLAMKEAAKNYKEGKRVGLAEISPGVVLYVCPRSDTIITILAKYGFFKGKAVLEDDRDALIGCVVWRRNRTSSVLSKTSEQKALSQVGRSVESPSDAVVVKPEVLHERHIDPPSAVEATSQISKVTENNTKDPPNVDDLPSKTVLKPAERFQDKFQISSGELPSTARHDLITLQTPKELVTEVASPKNSTNMGSSDPLHSEASEHGLGTHTRYAARTDDDDLPEFDFRTACGGLLPSPASELGLLNDKELFSERRDDCDSVSHLHPTSNAVGNNHQRVPQPASAFQVPATSPRADSRTSQKNIWDDDDNMPEWCPPDLQHEAITSHMPSPLTTALTAQRAPPWSLMPRNPTAQVRPPYCPSVQMRPLAGSAMRSSTSAPGYGNTNPAFRPRFSVFDRGPRINWRG